VLPQSFRRFWWQRSVSEADAPKAKVICLNGGLVISIGSPFLPAL